ncbi:LysM peptidoglycan-binding domain-containing protein [Streptomyces sp. TLI_105]|uniref:LysM peptidoglycan-binding domain-containing protein n=1 Tax=Streptomyces sp. TLI_105 TaxID=1881019 RepID=UPI00089A8B6E|nr:LysM peptidoglycan-binding domain-containing protein [Streptomyces sp. TLI_105]SEE57649.1 LysM domain-containing protein [Streptomyces sp. TLI_105]
MPAHRSLARRLPRALASVLVLAAVTAGLPWILTQATTAVWASGINAFTHLLTRTDTGAAFLLALVAVGWIAWATFVASLLVEIPAQLRGRTAPRLPGLRLSQRAAGTLVSGILILFASSTLATAAPALAAPAPSAPAATATALPATTPQTHAAPTTAAAEKTAGQTYTVRAVRPAESLWSIAEKLYGHGEQYTKIADANEGHTMADGTVFHADAPIRPGWILRLPDTPTVDAMPTPVPQQADSYTVTDGDTLWQVAEEQLGDGDRYTEIFDANKNKTQPDGGRLTDPDDIHTGWKLTLPHTTAPTTPPTEATPPPPRSADKPTTPAKPAPAAPTPAASTPPTTAPTAVPDRTKTPAPAQTPTRTISAPATPTARPEGPATASPSTTAEPAAPAAEEADGSLISEVTGIGMLTAGSLLLSLGTLRILQRRRRKPGQLPAPVDNEAAEQALHAAADPGSLELLDLALRTLAHHADREGLALPAATGARITARTVELLLPAAPHTTPDSDDTYDEDIDDLPLPEEESSALAPFTLAAPGRWVLDRAQDLLDPTDAAYVPAPYPGLVTLGTDPDGNHLLINLNVSRVLLLDGTPTAVRDTARVLALEAATSTWSDHAEIITVGLGDELPTLLPQNRIRAVPHLAAARADLAELLLEQRQQADADEAPPRMPWTLVCAVDIEEGEAKLLADTLTAARELPVALVLPAQGTAGAFGAFDDAIHLVVGTPRPQHVDVLDTDLIVQSLPEEDYQAFADLLRQAHQPAQPAEEPWTQVPSTAVSVTDDGDTSPAGLPPTPFAAFTATRPLTPVPPLPTPATPEQDSGEETEKQGETEEQSSAADSTGPGHATSTGTEEGQERGAAPLAEAVSAAPAAGSAAPAAQETQVVPEAGQDIGEDEPGDAVDLHAPEVQVLGPVAVTGIQASGHGPKLAQLAAYLYFKPGPPDTVREAMDPRSPWGTATLQTRISQLRNTLGTDPDGTLYLPRDRTGIYKLSPKVRSDWDRFTRLAERGLTRGPSAGIPDLEAALALVRGVPFGGTPPAWAAARYQEMLVRITDTVHTLATWHRQSARPDLDAARRVIRQGLDIDDSAELLYQDWMLIENQAGNREGVRTAYETLLTINRRLDVSTEPETEAIYERLVNRSA